jgi:hypothetical protein
MKSVFVTAVLAIGLSAHAESAKVVKASGKRLLIEFPSGTSIRAGQTIQVNGRGESIQESSSPSMGGSTGSRDRIVGAVAQFSVIGTSGGDSKSTTSTRIALQGRYGWNQKTYEYGPEATVAYNSGGGSSTTAMSGGAFFDYNLVPNEPGVSMVYGAGATLDFGFSNGNGSSSNTIEFFGGGQLKWWPAGLPVAVRGDAGLDLTRNAAAKTVTGVGFLAKGGFEVYF